MIHAHICHEEDLIKAAIEQIPCGEISWDVYSEVFLMLQLRNVLD